MKKQNKSQAKEIALSKCPVRNSTCPELKCRQEKGNGKRCNQLRWMHRPPLSEHTLPLGSFTDINILGTTAWFI